MAIRIEVRGTTIVVTRVERGSYVFIQQPDAITAKQKAADLAEVLNVKQIDANTWEN